MSRYRRSKRVYSLMSIRHLLLAVGVFLFLGFVQSEPVSARGNMLATGDQKFNIIEENNEKIDELKDITIVTEEELVANLNAIEAAQNEAQKLAEAKVQLAQEVKDTQEEIARLKAEIQDKKNRIVPEGRTASNAAGNSYAPGNCTWYVKQKRPDIGNQWGNANMWYSSAQSAGFKTGKFAKTGAIGVTMAGWAGHVVYVEKWLGNGKMIISEMNVGGLYNTQTREADESEFPYYIYEL